MAGLSTGAGAPVVKVYHEKSMILPDVSRVLACLYEKDVKFECVKDSYKDILRLQASRSVPVPLYDGPTFLQESRAICRYLAETYEQRGYPFLLGKDVLERASIEQWLRHEEHAFDPPSRALFCHLAFPLRDEDNDDINREKRKLEEVLAVYEQRLGESEFLAGNKFTLADLVHLPSTHHIVTSEKFAYLYDSRKNVQRWWNTISTRDSWQQVLRDMKSVEEQYQMEELERQQLQQQQQQQWQAEPPPTSGFRNIRIDPGKQTGTESRTILVPPPSAGQKSKAQPTDLKVKSPLEAELKEDTQGAMSGDERFSTKRLRKMFEESEAAEPPPTSGGRNICIDPRKQTGTESRTILVPPPSDGQQRLRKMFEESEAAEPKSQSTDLHAPEKEETPSIYKKPSDVQDRKSQADTVLADGKTGTPSTSKQAPDTPTTSADERRATPPPKGEMDRDDRGATEPWKSPSSNEQESQQRSEQEKMAPTDQPAAENIAVKDAQGETASHARHRGARDITKEAREADQRGVPSAPTQELPSSDQNGHQQYKARPTDLKVSDLSPMEAELKEDTPGVMSGDERFSTKRLRKMLEESEAAALKSQSTDSQAAAKEETTSVYKKPSDVQDRKSQADTVLADGKTGTPSTGTQGPDTPTSADERRATPPPKGEMARDGRGATEPRKSPSSNEQESQQRSEQAKMASQGVMSGDERFSTKRLRKMLEESEAAALKSQSTDSQAAAKEETPSVYKKPSDVQDRKSQADTVLADGKTGTPSTGTQAPDTPTSADERRATPPPKGEMARDDRGATEPRKSPSSNEQESAPPVPSQPAPPSPIQQVSPGAPSIDELDKTAGVNRRAPPSTPKQTPTDARNALAPVQGAAPSADGISDKQSDKSTMDERALEKTPRQAPPSDTRHTSASIQGEIRVPRGPSDDMLGKTLGTDQIATPAASKPTPTRGEVPDVHDTGDDATKKPAVDTKAAPTQQRQESVSRSQQTTEQIKGVAPTSHGSTGDELAKIAMADESATPPAPVQAPASDGMIASTALKGGILDARGKNEAVKPSVADPRGMLTTPRRPAPTPDTQRRTTSDQASDQVPPLPSFTDTRNEKTDIAEAGRTNTIAPNEQPGGRIPKNAGAPAAGPSPMRSQKNMNEAHNDGPSIQQLSSDQSRAQLAENKKQGDDATPLTEIGKPKENDFLANANQNNTGQAQVASADGPSKLQMHSDQNKHISSEDIGKRTNEIVSYRSSATSREMPPSVPEKSMGEKQLQGDKSSTSLQDNVKQGSEAALSMSGTEQPKKKDLLANVDQNSGKTPGEALQKSEEQTSADTQQVKSNTGNSKSDGSSKPTQFDGNKGNLPESQRRDSSTNP